MWVATPLLDLYRKVSSIFIRIGWLNLVATGGVMKKKRVVSRTLILLLLTIFGFIQVEFCQAEGMGGQFLGTWRGIYKDQNNVKVVSTLSFSPQGTWQNQLAFPTAPNKNGGILVMSGLYNSTGPNQIYSRPTESKMCSADGICYPYPIDMTPVPMSFEFNGPDEMSAGGVPYHRVQ
jgi:hypothetical protein